MATRSWIMGLSAVSLTIWNGVAQASEGADPAPVPTLIALEPMQVPVIDHGRVVGRLELRATWQAADGDEALEQRVPALRSTLVAAAIDHASLNATPGQPIDPQALAKRLQDEARAGGFKGALLVMEAVTRPG